MATDQAVIKAAVAELETVESPQDSNKTKYGVWYGWNGVAWCAIFMSYVFAKAGQYLPPIQSKKGFASTALGVQYAKSHGLWRTVKQGGRPGDLIFFNFDSDAGPEHVGLVVKRNADGSYTTIEGNTSAGNNANGGQVQKRQRRGSVILGFMAVPGVTKAATASKPQTWESDGFEHLTLEKGESEKREIIHLQRRLNAMGANLVADGNFGDQTHRAVVNFQRAKSLTPDGVVGPITWRWLH